MKDPTRRQIIARLTALGAGSLAALLAPSCTRGPSPEEVAREAQRYDAELACTDLRGLHDAEVRARENNEYVDRSPHATQKCFNCTNFIPPETEGVCARCDTVKGPIHPLGWCTAWTLKRT